MNSFKFANLEAFNFLWGVLFLFILSIWIVYLNKNKMNKIFSKNITLNLAEAVSYNKRKLKIFLECLAITFFIVALARLQFGQSQQDVKSEGIEVVILFDVSNSMLAEDVKPSRIELAKKELMRFLDQLSGDRVGIIAFAGSSVVLSPVTTDMGAIKMFVESLSPDVISTQGTEFSKALQEAKSAFKRGGIEEDENSTVTRAIVIVSDGEDHEEGAVKISKSLVNDGIRIFSLGVGTEKGGPIPVRDEFGNLKGYRKDRNGKVILTQTQGSVLKSLAQAGQGAFYHLTFGGNVPKLLFNDIRKLESTEFATGKITNYEERFQIFLVIGLILIFIEILLSDKKPKGRIWKGRFEVLEK